MRHDFATYNRLRPQTVAAMWTAYAAGATAYGDGLRRGRRAGRATAAAAAPVAAAGLSLVAAGMGRFASASQIGGTDTGHLTTGGVYRYSRNPQYVGLLLALAAGAVARRSTQAGAVVAVTAAAYRAWVPLEERSLSEVFGTEYDTYVRGTRRWLGPPSAA